jgi:hypothetical protein
MSVSEVEQLAMALFNAKVKWVEQVLHVVLKEGITLIVPHSEATLKGILDEAIIKCLVLIYVTQSPKALYTGGNWRKEKVSRNVSQWSLQRMGLSPIYL